MPETIITLYYFFDERLKAIDYREDKQAKVSTAEIMTIAAVAVEFFTGNHQKSLDFLTSHHREIARGDFLDYVPAFSKSRFNRRLHAIPETLWQFAFPGLAKVKKQTATFLVDTFPVPVCRNYIRRLRRP